MRLMIIIIGVIISSITVTQVVSAKPEKCEGHCANCNDTICDEGQSCYAINIYSSAVCRNQYDFMECRDPQGKCNEFEEGYGGDECSACGKVDCPKGTFCIVENLRGEWLPMCRIIKGDKIDYEIPYRFVSSDESLATYRIKICEGANWCSMCIGKKCPNGKKCYVGYEDMKTKCMDSPINPGYKRCKDKKGACKNCPDCSKSGVKYRCYASTTDPFGKAVECLPNYYPRHKQCEGGDGSKSQIKKWKGVYNKAKSEKSAAWKEYKDAKKVAYGEYKDSRIKAFNTYKDEKAKAYGKYKNNKSEEAWKIYLSEKESKYNEYKKFKAKYREKYGSVKDSFNKIYKDKKAIYLKAKQAYNLSRGKID